MIMKRIVQLFCGLFTLAGVSVHGANIYWVSFHPADNVPSAAALTAGFTQAPDIGYTDLLRANGHNVTRIVTSGTPNTALLNTGDLVIISRSVPSGDYELDAETAAWNGITAPTMVLGGYVLRNSRLGYTTGTTIPDVNSSNLNLRINNPSHPIFAGISLGLSNVTVNPFANLVSYTNSVQLGISVNTSPLAGGGTVLATVANPGDAAVNGMVIGEWQQGATMGNSPPDTLGGHRLVFLTGSRERIITSEGSGIFDLTADGQRMFLNAVTYMAVPEPATWAMFALGGAALFFRRRK
jgi:hypothetical protein